MMNIGKLVKDDKFVNSMNDLELITHWDNVCDEKFLW